MIILIIGSIMANAGNQTISDRDLLRAIQENNLELFQSYLAGNVNWHATDLRGNTLGVIRKNHG